jgi:hypothetical protein
LVLGKIKTMGFPCNHDTVDGDKCKNTVTEMGCGAGSPRL